MYVCRTLEAIFAIFILCVHCDSAANYNEITKIYGKYEAFTVMLCVRKLYTLHICKYFIRYYDFNNQLLSISPTLGVPVLFSS